jgi:DNA-binding Lrp family transcriptional regulator
MKQKDLLILNQLRENGRMSLTDIHTKTGIPVSTIFDRIKILEKRIITRYTTLINPEYLRFALRSTFITKKIPESDNINSIYALSKPGTYAITANFRTIQEYKQFKRKAKIIKEFPIQKTLGEEMMLF